MSKKIIIAIIFLFILLGIVGWLLISSKTGSQGESGAPEDSGGIFGGFFPFGNSTNNTNEGSVNNGGGDNTPISTFNGNQLQKLTTDSVVGYIGTSTENGYVVRYMDRASGNIFDIDLETFTKERISNTTWPRVHDIVWHRNAENFVFRYVNENNVIKTYQASLVQKGASSTDTLREISGVFLDDDIKEIVSDRNNTSFIYLKPNSVGVIGFFNDYYGNTTQVFTSQFNEWDLGWPNNEFLTATTKPSHNIPGFTYTVNLEDGSFRKIFGGKDGLTTLPDTTGNIILFSENKDGFFTTNLFFVEDRETRFFPTRTLTEKCVWDKIIETDIYCAASGSSLSDNVVPDDWYKGNNSFNDSFVKVDVKKNIITDILPELEDSTVDVINPSISEDGKYFIFVNKKDSTLWSLELDRPVVEEVSTTTPSS